MKKLFTISIALLMLNSIQAQITLEHTYLNDIEIYDLGTSGYKYWDVHYDEVNQIYDYAYAYSIDHSLYKTITPVIDPIITYDNGYPEFPTENLFNTDNLLEYIIMPNDQYYNYFMRVYNENGVLVFSKDSVSPDIPRFINTPSGTKMIIDYESNGEWITDVYSLPGTLPTGIQGSASNHSEIADNPYPNPTKNLIILPYQLPANVHQGQLQIFDIQGNQLREMNIGSAFKNIELNTDEFSAGTYLYYVNTSEGKSGAKKFVVAK